MKLLLASLAFAASLFGQALSYFPQPMKGTIAQLPATCIVGQLYFATNATAGQNLYGCTATNTWTREAFGNPGGADTQVQFNDSSAFGGDSGLTYNKTTKILSATGGFQSTDGTKTSCVTFPELTANGSSGFTICGADSQSVDGCVIISGNPANSGDGLFYTGSTAMTTEDTPRTCRIMQWTAQSGTSGGAGFSGTATLGTSAISSGACATVVTVSKTGMATTDSLNWTFNADPTGVTGYAAATTGMLAIIAYPTANNANFKVCNNTASSITPGAITLNFSAAQGAIATGTSALGTGAISSGACATVVTTSATGTVSTSTISASFNSDPTAVTGYSPSTGGMLTIIGYPSTDNVNFKVCNNTTSSITPGARTLNWRVF